MDVLWCLMRNSKDAIMIAATLAVMTLLSGCGGPFLVSDRLKEVRVEAQTLMKTHAPASASSFQIVPKRHWPAAIKRLEPTTVTVYPWGVDIKRDAIPYGSYGYQVPRSKAVLPRPADCYTERSPGVFWHDPC